MAFFPVLSVLTRSTWALVPVNPKALTPARRGLPLVSHGVASFTTCTGRVSHGMCGDGLLKCRVCGSISFCSESTTLMRPATPAADSRCPILVLAVPTSSGRFGSRPAPYAAAAACTSIGSPNGVPVPCASR